MHVNNYMNAFCSTDSDDTQDGIDVRQIWFYRSCWKCARPHDTKSDQVESPPSEILSILGTEAEIRVPLICGRHKRWLFEYNIEAMENTHPPKRVHEIMLVRINMDP